jgi:hypothetical protein
MTTIYVTQFAHTDIGYTLSQDVIRDLYVRYYDRVLELCEKHRDAPEVSRFKWTCETFWQVEHYLRHRPERTREFVEAARRGQIEVTAGYLHFADLIDAETYRRSLERARDFCAAHGLPLRTLVHSDINGWPWSVADDCAEMGVDQFVSHINTDSATEPLAGRGTVTYAATRGWGLKARVGAPFRIPHAFHWQGPRGGTMLHWLGEQYHLGNQLALSGLMPFGLDKTEFFWESDEATAETLYALARDRVANYLADLKEAGYKLPVVYLPTSGYQIDNSPPDDRWLDIIRLWNRDHESVQLRTATIGEWFAALRQHAVARDLPTRRAAWPDHWAHGLGSCTRRIAQIRHVQRIRPGIEQVVRESDSIEASRYIERAFEHERFALEHTFSAWSTSHRSWSLNEHQDAVKELEFHRAESSLLSALTHAIRKHPTNNASGWSVYVAAQEANAKQHICFNAGDSQLNTRPHALLNSLGQLIPIQIDQPETQVYAAVVPVEPGLNRFELVEIAPDTAGELTNAAKHPSSGWVLELAPDGTGLVRLTSPSGREWVDRESPYRFGEVVHERVIHPQGRDAVGNTARSIALGSATPDMIAGFSDRQAIHHSRAAATTDRLHSPGAVFDVARVCCVIGALGRVVYQWRNYHASGVVELVVEIDKHWSDQPEVVYVAFPFAAPGGLLQIAGAGGWFVPGDHGESGQIPGTCVAYYTVQQAGIQITAPDGASIRWSPLDAPLMVPNALDTRQWEAHLPWTWNGLLASMPVNHYWHTNFPASQRGAIRQRYQLCEAHTDVTRPTVLQGIVARPLRSASGV